MPEELNNNLNLDSDLTPSPETVSTYGGPARTSGAGPGGRESTTVSDLRSDQPGEGHQIVEDDLIETPQELKEWLEQDPAHRQAYDFANRTLRSGLEPRLQKAAKVKDIDDQMLEAAAWVNQQIQSGNYAALYDWFNQNAQQYAQYAGIQQGPPAQQNVPAEPQKDELAELEAQLIQIEKDPYATETERMLARVNRQQIQQNRQLKEQFSGVQQFTTSQLEQQKINAIDQTFQKLGVTDMTEKHRTIDWLSRNGYGALATDPQKTAELIEMGYLKLYAGKLKQLGVEEHMKKAQEKAAGTASLPSTPLQDRTSAAPDDEDIYTFARRQARSLGLPG